MQREQSLVTEADSFIEENRELLEDPETSSNVLGRILNQGAPIATVLTEEVEVAADPAVEAANALESAIRDESVSPKELKQLELTHQGRKAEFDALNDALTRFVAFLEDVKESYYDGGGAYQVEDTEDAEPPDNGLYIKSIPHECPHGHRWEAAFLDVDPDCYPVPECPECGEQAVMAEWSPGQWGTFRRANPGNPWYKRLFG